MFKRKAQTDTLDKADAYLFLRLLEAQEAAITSLEPSHHKVRLERQLTKLNQQMRRIWAAE